MSERTLLASVVLFRELYDSNKDVYDVIGEFVKAAFLFTQKWSANATEVTHLLSKEFELDIPEAVVATTLHKRLHRRDGILSFDRGLYSTSQAQLVHSQKLVDELRKLQQHQADVLARLTGYVETTLGALNSEQRELLAKCFCDYLFDNDLNNRFSENISAFIIKNQADSDITDQLNAVREGFVLYDGVRHTPDLSSIGAWKSKLVVFLDTEHLFNAVGLNGELHKQLFSDFSRLASDVREKGARMISLCYFSECADEVERFFRVAEHIIEGIATLDPSKPAMVAILEGCSTKSDVLAKKARFFSDLKSRGVHLADTNTEAAEESFNVESAKMLGEVRKELEAKGREFQEEKCLSTLRMFTKINTLRNGNSSRAFEDIGSILVSGSYIAKFLAFHTTIRHDGGGIPHATDLEFITNRLWFKLHKNLAKGVDHPHSLSVLAKAQVVLASQLNNSVSGKFAKIKIDFDTGVITEEQTKFLFNELRSHSAFPETLNATNVESALTFLDHKDYEHHLREKSLLEQEAEKGRSAVAELATIREVKEARRRKVASRLSAAMLAAVLIVGVYGVIYCFQLAYHLLTNLGSGGDDRLAILGVLVTFVVGLAPLVGYRAIWALIKKSHTCIVERICAARA